MNEQGIKEATFTVIEPYARGRHRFVVAYQDLAKEEGFSAVEKIGTLRDEVGVWIGNGWHVGVVDRNGSPFKINKA